MPSTLPLQTADQVIRCSSEVIPVCLLGHTWAWEGFTSLCEILLLNGRKPRHV